MGSCAVSVGLAILFVLGMPPPYAGQATTHAGQICRELDVVSPTAQQHVSGRYLLADGQTAQGLPVWKRDDAKYWLYTMKSGKWGVGGERVPLEDFNSDTAWIYCPDEPNQKLPHAFRCVWKYWDQAISAWTADAGITVRAACGASAAKALIAAMWADPEDAEWLLEPVLAAREEIRASRAPSSAQPLSLRWRAATYGQPHGAANKGAVKHVVYGGDWVTQAFMQRGFHGPVADDNWDVLFTHRPQRKALMAASLPRRRGRLVSHCEYFVAAGQKGGYAKHTANVLRLRRLPGVCEGAEREVAASSEEGEEGEIADELQRCGLAGGGGPKHLRVFNLAIEAQREQWRQAVQEDMSLEWVVKPTVAGRSQGIRLLRGEDALGASLPSHLYVAQEYIRRPFLGFGGRKFHLRLYILVTRWKPIGAFLFDEGIVFRSRLAYDSDNTSVERDIFSGVSESVEPLALSTLWNFIDTLPLGARPSSSAEVNRRIVRLLAELLGTEAVRESFGEPRDGAVVGAIDIGEPGSLGCFDFFGADVMLDDSLEPYVLEFNIGPNLYVDEHGPSFTQLYRAVKGPLLRQMIHWMELRSRSPPRTVDEANLLETQTLHNFTRIV